MNVVGAGALPLTHGMMTSETASRCLACERTGSFSALRVTAAHRLLYLTKEKPALRQYDIVPLKEKTKKVRKKNLSFLSNSTRRQHECRKQRVPITTRERKKKKVTF
jgi:hypothetical protein